MSRRQREGQLERLQRQRLGGQQGGRGGGVWGGEGREGGEGGVAPESTGVARGRGVGGEAGERLRQTTRERLSRIILTPSQLLANSQ